MPPLHTRAGTGHPSAGALELGATAWPVPGDAAGTQIVAQAERAEALGLGSFWLPEHHFSAAASLPAPLLLLAAAAARTARIRLATTSYLLPVRHPLHAAAEVAVLDHLCGGRLILGLGRGFDPSLFAAFEVPAAEKRQRFERILEQMRRAWRGEPVAWVAAEDAGPLQRPVRLSPLPLQQPHPPLWVAAFGPRAIEQAGRLGLPYLASPLEPLAVLESNWARHREAAERAGHGPSPVVPVMRAVFVGRSRARIAEVRDELRRVAERAARSGRRGARPRAEPDDWALVGELEEVRDRSQAYRERIGMTHLIASAYWAELAPGEREASLAGFSALASR